MENLKNALGEELFGQVTAAIDAYNAVSYTHLTLPTN